MSVLLREMHHQNDDNLNAPFVIVSWCKKVNWKWVHFTWGCCTFFSRPTMNAITRTNLSAETASGCGKEIFAYMADGRWVTRWPPNREVACSIEKMFRTFFRTLFRVSLYLSRLADIFFNRWRSDTLFLRKIWTTY
jgi:hypothetical protein